MFNNTKFKVIDICLFGFLCITFLLFERIDTINLFFTKYNSLFLIICIIFAIITMVNENFILKLIFYFSLFATAVFSHIKLNKNVSFAFSLVIFSIFIILSIISLLNLQIFKTILIKQSAKSYFDKDKYLEFVDKLKEKEKAYKNVKTDKDFMICDEKFKEFNEQEDYIRRHIPKIFKNIFNV